VEKYYLDSNGTALLLIDYQERLYPAISGKKKLLKPLKTLIHSAKYFEMPIYVTEQYPQGLGETLPEIKLWLEDCNTHYWEKTAFNAFLPEVQKQIEADQIKNLIIAGIETHICVFQTVRDLLKNNYSVFLAADAVGSIDKKNKNNAIELMRDMGAVISNSQSMAYDLLKDSKNPNFKAISNLLKE